MRTFLLIALVLAAAAHAQVVPADYATAAEGELAAALAAHPRVERAARRVADTQVFDAARALGLSAVRVSPVQLSDVHAAFARGAARLGADPGRFEVYVAAGDEYSVFSWGYADGRTVIALSTRCLRDLAPPELEFALATEVAHAVADHNVYNNVNRMIVALEDATFRQTYNIADRAVRDIHNYDLTSELFARLLGVPRVVAAMLGVGAVTSRAMSLAATWVIEALEKPVFAALAKWRVATQTSANRAALLVAYLERRAEGLPREAALEAALETSARTIVKFMLRDRPTAERVDVAELLAQAREMLEREKAVPVVKQRFVAWVLARLKEWIWGRTAFGAMPPDLLPRTYLEELVELVDWLPSPQLASFLSRVEARR